MIAKTSYLAAGLMLTALWGASAAHGQCTGVTISGAVYSGTGTVTYTLNALGEPVVHRNVALAPAATPLTPAVDNARVMIQNMEDGAVVGYGTFADPTLNAWSACVPAGHLYIAMYSATGHDLTSRVFDLRGDVFVQGTQVAMVTDAYLPALHMNLTTGVVDPANPVQALGNILVYAFEENQVNGAPDWPIDPGLPGVYMELYDPITGAVVASGTTAVGGPGAPTIATKDGLVFGGGEVAGLLYLQDIPPGEYRLRATPGTTDAAGLSWTGGWYHTYTMEGTQEWEILIYPGDPGTEAGAFMAWFGFVKKLGQLPAGTGGSSISGVVEDADVPFEAVPPAAQCVWPTNWDPNICEPPEAGAPLDPTFINQGVSTNGPLANAFLVLWKGAGPNSQVLATAETNAIGEFSFANIPAGNYNIFFVDIALNNIFGEMRLAVDGVNPLVLPTVANEVPGIPLAIVPRFGARVNGFVMDGNNVGIAGATVNLRYQAGNAAFSTVTDATGWYNFDFLPEIETMAMIDVEPPAGYRGKLVTDTYWPAAGVPADPNCTGWDNCPIVPAPCDPTVDAGCIVCGYDVNNTPIPCSTANGTVIQRNGKNRWVQYYTANYKSNLILEPIPAGVGQIHGLVFNDSLAMGTWVADGVYDKLNEGLVENVTIELRDAAGNIIPLLDPLTGLPVTDPVTGLNVQDPATVTASGAYDPAVAVAQGYIRPGISVPPDEWGGFFSGPMPGAFEFRDVAPGTYTLRLTLPNGFHAPGEVVPLIGPAFVDQLVTIGGVAGFDFRHNFGIHTLVPQAGRLEGGIFADQVLDLRWYSAFSEEKALLTGLGVIVRDYLGYTLDTLVQPSAVCYPGTTLLDPTVTPLPYGAICDRPDLGFGVEIDRLVAPGLRLYWGNDPALPACTGTGGVPTPADPPCHNPNLFNLELPYTMGQGLTKYEADWSLPVAIAGVAPHPICTTAMYVSSLTGSSATTEGTKWTATAHVTVSDPLGPMPGAHVMASWSTGEQSAAITNGSGQATLRLETVEGMPIGSVTATLTVTAGEGDVGVFGEQCGTGNCLEIASPLSGGGTTLCGVIAVCGDAICEAGEECVCLADCTPPDTDNDGANDCVDVCVNDPTKTITAGQCGCGVLETDTDGDGTADCIDACPLDPAKILPGQCGCGLLETDSDGDGTPDCIDGCPNDPTKIAPGVCGCGIGVDTDGDGTGDCLDGCPLDPAKIAPGQCGCGAPDTDADGDGTADCIDGCPADGTKTDPGTCGCGIPEGTCGVCVPAGVAVSSLTAQTWDMGENKWRAEVTVDFQDAACGTPVTLNKGDLVWYRFGGGEARKVKANGNSASILIRSETIEKGGATINFTITHVARGDYAGGAVSIVINRPF